MFFKVRSTNLAKHRTLRDSIIIYSSEFMKLLQFFSMKWKVRIMSQDLTLSNMFFEELLFRKATSVMSSVHCWCKSGKSTSIIHKVRLLRGGSSVFQNLKHSPACCFHFDHNQQQCLISQHKIKKVAELS